MGEAEDRRHRADRMQTTQQDNNPPLIPRIPHLRDEPDLLVRIRPPRAGRLHPPYLFPVEIHREVRVQLHRDDVGDRPADEDHVLFAGPERLHFRVEADHEPLPRGEETTEEESEFDGIWRVPSGRVEGSVRVWGPDDDRAVEDAVAGEFLEEASDDAGVGEHRRSDRVPAALEDERESLRRRGQDARRRAAFRLLSKDLQQARGLEPPNVVVDLMWLDLARLREVRRVVGWL